MKKRMLISVFLSFLISHLFFPAEITEAAEKRSVIEGERAVDFTLKAAEGKEIRLSDYHGKVVVVNFWTTWCTYCQEEMDELMKFWGETKSLNVELLCINVTSSEKSKQDVLQFVKGHGFPFQVVLDVKGKVSKSYQIIGIPTTFIIDKKGIINKKILGPVTAGILRDTIKQM